MKNYNMAEDLLLDIFTRTIHI